MKGWEPPEFTRARRREGLVLIVCMTLLIAATVCGLSLAGVVR